MKIMKDCIPETIKLDKYSEYNDTWNSVYNKRIKKVNENKAVHSANAIVYAEILKDFINNKG